MEMMNSMGITTFYSEIWICREPYWNAWETHSGSVSKALYPAIGKLSTTVARTCEKRVGGKKVEGTGEGLKQTGDDD